MDDLLREFLTETTKVSIVWTRNSCASSRSPTTARFSATFFVIKGTCGFLSLPRLEALAHAAEGLMGQFRDGLPVTTEAVTLILSSIDRIKSILDAIETSEREPAGDDLDLIESLNRFGATRPMRAPPSGGESAPTRPSATARGEPAGARPAKNPRDKSRLPSGSRTIAPSGSPTIRSASMSRLSTIS